MALDLREDQLGGAWQTTRGEEFLPLYSGSSIWFYNHRYNEVTPKKDKSKKQKTNLIKVSIEQYKNPYYYHIPMFWIFERKTFRLF